MFCHIVYTKLNEDFLLSWPRTLLSCITLLSFLTQETFLCAEILNAVNTELHVNAVISECVH